MRYISDETLRKWAGEHSVLKTPPDANEFSKGPVYSYMLNESIFRSFVDDGIDGDALSPIVIGKDGKPIRPGDHVWGQDGREWVVDGVGGANYDVIGHETGKDLNHMQPLRSTWLSHERPVMTRRQVAKELREIGTFDTPDTPRWSAINKRLAKLADELEGHDE